MATKHVRVLLTFTRQSDHRIVEIEAPSSQA